MKIYLFSIFIISASFLEWTGGAAASSLPVKQVSRFYILPIKDVKSSKSTSFQLVLFKSIYNFMRIIPSLDVPDERVLKDLSSLTPVLSKWETTNHDLVPDAVYGADYILYGDYYLKQKKPEKAVLRVGVWSKGDDKNIFSKTYETPTDIEIFDCIDMILKNVVDDVLKIDFTLARIDFDIKPGPENYEIYINNKLIDSPFNQDYKKSMNVLGEQLYIINLVRTRDGSTVYTESGKLAAKQDLAVGYTAACTVVINPVRYGISGRKYIYSVDGRPAYENEVFTNMSAVTNHSISVIDQDSNIIYQSPINIVDGATVNAAPEEIWGGPLHVRFYTGSSAFAGIGLEYFPWRYFWIEAGSGVSWENSFYQISPYLDAGFYIFGDMKTDFRAGIALSGGYYAYLPASGFARPYDYSAGVYADAEWMWLNLKLGYSYDFGAKQFFPAIAAGFKF